VSEQDKRVSNGPESVESVSNAPEEPRDEVAVPEGYEVSEESFEGEGLEGTQAKSLQEKAAEAVPKLEQMRTAPDTSRLPDIAEASFGPFHPGMAVEERLTARDFIIGTDDRIQIMDTTQYPWRAIADLIITAADNSLWKGTAWFIGPHTLATAGHVVFIYNPSKPYHGWVRSIQVWPGRNDSIPTFPPVTSTDFRTVTPWAQSGDLRYDYGAIRIPTELGNTVGRFGFGVHSDSDLLGGWTFCLSGYPVDKPDGTQWWHCRQLASVDSTYLYYDIDIYFGQSGSPVFRFIGGDVVASGIHSAGLGPTVNRGTRIVQTVYDNLVAWKA
jgi:glutamyl endopeptidase